MLIIFFILSILFILSLTIFIFVYLYKHSKIINNLKTFFLNLNFKDFTYESFKQKHPLEFFLCFIKTNMKACLTYLRQLTNYKSFFYANSQYAINNNCKSLVTFNGSTLFNSLFFYFKNTFIKVPFYLKFNHIFYIFFYVFIYITNSLSILIISIYKYLDYNIFFTNKCKSLIVWNPNNITIENFIHYYYIIIMNKIFSRFYNTIKRGLIKKAVTENSLIENKLTIIDYIKTVIIYLKNNLLLLLYNKNLLFIIIYLFNFIFNMGLPTIFQIDFIDEIFIVTLAICFYGISHLISKIPINFKFWQNFKKKKTETQTSTADTAENTQKEDIIIKDVYYKNLWSNLKVIKQNDKIIYDDITDTTLTEDTDFTDPHTIEQILDESVTEDFVDFSKLNKVFNSESELITNSNYNYDLTIKNLGDKPLYIKKGTIEHILLSNKKANLDVNEVLYFSKKFADLKTYIITHSINLNSYSILFNDFFNEESIYLHNLKYRDLNYFMVKEAVDCILKANDYSEFTFDIKQINKDLKKVLENDHKDLHYGEGLFKAYLKKQNNSSQFYNVFKNYKNYKKAKNHEIFKTLPNKLLKIIKFQSNFYSKTNLIEICHNLEHFKSVMLSISEYSKYNNNELDALENILRYKQYLDCFDKYETFKNENYKQIYFNELETRYLKLKSKNLNNYNFFDFLLNKTGYFFNNIHRNLHYLRKWIDHTGVVNDNFNPIDFNNYLKNVINLNIPIKDILEDLTNINNIYDIYKQSYEFDFEGNILNVQDHIIDYSYIINNLKKKNIKIIDYSTYKLLVYNEFFKLELANKNQYLEDTLIHSFFYNKDLILALFESIKYLELSSVKYPLFIFDIYTCDLVRQSPLYPFIDNLYKNLSKIIKDMRDFDVNLFYTKINHINYLSKSLEKMGVDPFLSIYSDKKDINVTKELLIEAAGTLSEFIYEFELFLHTMEDSRDELAKVIYALDYKNLDIIFNDSIFLKSKVCICLEYTYKNFYNYIVEKERLTDLICQGLLNNINVWNPHYINARKRLLMDFHTLPRKSAAITIDEVHFILKEIEPHYNLILIDLYNQFKHINKDFLYSHKVDLRSLLNQVIDLEDDRFDEDSDKEMVIAYQGDSDVGLFNKLIEEIGNRPVVIYPFNAFTTKKLEDFLNLSASENLREEIDVTKDLFNIINDCNRYNYYKENNVFYDWLHSEKIIVNEPFDDFINKNNKLNDNDYATNITVNTDENNSLDVDKTSDNYEDLIINDCYNNQQIIDLNFGGHTRKKKEIKSLINIIDNKNFYFFLEKNKKFLLSNNLYFFFEDKFLEYLYNGIKFISQSNNLDFTSNSFLLKLELDLLNFNKELKAPYIDLNDVYGLGLFILNDINDLNLKLNTLYDLNGNVIFLNDNKYYHDFFWYKDYTIMQSKFNGIFVNWYQGLTDKVASSDWPLQIKGLYTSNNLNLINSYLANLNHHIINCNFLHNITKMLNDVLLPHSSIFSLNNNNLIDFYIYKNQLNKKIKKLNNEINTLLIKMNANNSIINNIINLSKDLTDINAIDYISSKEFYIEFDMLLNEFRLKNDKIEFNLSALNLKLMKLHNISFFFYKFGNNPNSLNILKILHSECAWYLANINKISFLFNFINNLENISEVHINATFFNLIFENIDWYRSLLNFDHINTDLNHLKFTDLFNFNNITWYENKYNLKILDKNESSLDFSTIHNIFNKVKEPSSREELDDIGISYLNNTQNLNIVSSNASLYNISDTIIDNNRPGANPSETYKLYFKKKFICNNRNYSLKKKHKSINNIDFYNKRILLALKSKSLKKKKLDSGLDFLSRLNNNIINKGVGYKHYIHNLRKSIYTIFYRKDLHYKMYYFFNVNKPSTNFDDIDFCDSENENLVELLEEKSKINKFAKNFKEDIENNSKIAMYAGDDYNIQHFKRGQALVEDLYNIRRADMDSNYLRFQKEAELIVSGYFNKPDDNFWDFIYPDIEEPYIRQIFISSLTIKEKQSFIALTYDKLCVEYEDLQASLKKQYEINTNLNFDEFMQMSPKKKKEFCDSFFFYESNLANKELAFDLYSSVGMPTYYDYKQDIIHTVSNKPRKYNKYTGIPLFKKKKKLKKNIEH